MATFLVEIKITEEVEATSHEKAIEKVGTMRVADCNCWDEEVSHYPRDEQEANKL